MPRDDDIDFDAFMRDRGVQRLGEHDRSRSRGEAPPGAGVPSASADNAKDQARDRAVTQAHEARDEARAGRREAEAGRADAERQRARAETERDELRAALQQAQAESEALAKERKALQRQLSATPAPPAPPPTASLRQRLAARGVTDEGEATEVLLALLGHAPADLLDGLNATADLAERLEAHVALVCERSECQPQAPMAVVRVPPERCDVCGGSNIRAAWEVLLRASRVAGVTRLVIVGGSPPYHAQLRELSRGTDLKLDLVSGRSKPGRRRARNRVERVVIWGSTILDHGTTAAYEHLGDRLVRVTDRGISRMLRTVAEALENSPD